MDMERAMFIDHGPGTTRLGMLYSTVGIGRVGVIERQGGVEKWGKKLHIGSYLEKKTALQ